MVIISDGNIAENQTNKGIPLSSSYDKWTNNYYSNRTLDSKCYSFFNWK